MRLFIAIDLDEPARRAIAAEQSRIVQAVGGRETAMRRVGADQLHLTLAFLGDVADAAVPALVEAVTAPVDHPKFAIEFGGLGVFPPRGAPRIVWIGITSGAAETIAVQREIADRVRRAGVALEDRPFSPHLTIARWREARPADRQRVLALDRGRALAAVAVDAVTLYKSELSSDGATHTVLARAGLR